MHETSTLDPAGVCPAAACTAVAPCLGPCAAAVARCCTIRDPLAASQGRACAAKGAPAVGAIAQGCTSHARVTTDDCSGCSAIACAGPGEAQSGSAAAATAAALPGGSPRACKLPGLCDAQGGNTPSPASSPPSPSASSAASANAQTGVCMICSSLLRTTLIQHREDVIPSRYFESRASACQACCAYFGSEAYSYAHQERCTERTSMACWQLLEHIR